LYCRTVNRSNLNRSGALQGRVYTYRGCCADPDGDRSSKYQLNDFPDGMTIDPSSGQIRWSFPRTPCFREERNKVKVTVDDGDGGTDPGIYNHP